MRLASDFMNMPIPAAQLRKVIVGVVVQSKKARRDDLLCKLFEWKNFVRMEAPASSSWTG